MEASAPSAECRQAQPLTNGRFLAESSTCFCGRRSPLPPTFEIMLRVCQRVEVRAIDVQTVFRSFDDYWSPLLGGQAPTLGYAMSLSEERRTTLERTQERGA